MDRNDDVARDDARAAPRDHDDGEDAAALRERLARVSAELDNFRKRARREHAEQMRYATEEFAKALLPVVDNLERALAHGDDDAQAVVRGVELVLKQLQQALAEHGVRAVDAEGAPFDPARHEALGFRTAADAPPLTVVEELQRGYALHDRLLRPARVLVSPEEDDPPPGPPH